MTKSIRELRFLNLDSSLENLRANVDTDRKTMESLITECRRGNFTNFGRLVKFGFGEVRRQFPRGEFYFKPSEWNTWYRGWKALNNSPTQEAGKEASSEVKSDV